jgi:hypothetical protein
MGDISIDTRELERLAQDLLKAEEPVRKEAIAATQRVGAQVAQRARAGAPRDRPWLATQGIHRKTWRPSDGVHVDVFTGMDERGVNVGFLVDAGTSEISPNPFLSSQAAWAGHELEEQLTKILDPFETGPTAEIGDD